MEVGSRTTEDGGVPRTVGLPEGRSCRPRTITVTVALLATLLSPVVAGAVPTQESGDRPPPGRGNPAALNCFELGGTHSVETRGDGGELGVCYLEDNRQCEAWALLRGACPAGGLKVTGYVTKAARYCAITGGAYTATSAAGSDSEQGSCILANGRVCDVWEYFNGTCDATSASEPGTFESPFAYCAAVGTIDLPDARYTGPAVPGSLIQRLVEEGVVAADAPPEDQQHAVWRCMSGEVVACHVGANLPCLEQADASQTPSSAMAEFCTANPSAETIPAAVTGRATVYAWRCESGTPVVVKQLLHADARGFLTEHWHRVPRLQSRARTPAPSPLSVRVSHDGRVASIPIDPDNVEATRNLLQTSRFDSHDISMSLYEPVGLLPQIVVIGQPEDVASFVATANDMFTDTGRKHLVAISARLTQFSDSEIHDLGINLFPGSITYSGSFEKYLHAAWDGYIDVDVNESGGANILVADESLSRGKTLVASQVFTPNGVLAEISDVQHDPAFGTDTYGNIQTNYQDLETNIEVTPVVMDFDRTTSTASRVRLDITVKVSLITGEKRMATVSAPVYSDKSFKTTRVFPADGRTYLVGSFVSDSDIESRTGVPFLSKIPLIKYLFSQKSITRNRSYALLTLAVGVIPDNLSSDDLWRRQADTTKAAAAKGKEKHEGLQDVPSILDKALAPTTPTEKEKKP
jgi:putative hemolysin